MRRILVITTFIISGLFVQSACEASLAGSLGLQGQSKKAAKQLAKAGKKALKGGKKGGQVPPGTVSPYTTLLAQLLGTQEGMFLLIHDAYNLNLVGKHKTKRFIRKTIKADFKVVGPAGRKEFKQYNGGAKRRQVRRDYFAFMFQGGLLPIYY